MAEILGFRVGDRIDTEALYGQHRRWRLPVVGLVRDPIGLQIHVSQEELGRWLQEPGYEQRLFLRVAEADRAAALRRWSEIPGVLGTSTREDGLRQFRQQTGRTRSTFVAIASAFGMVLAVGVVYNNARIALSARARDLASLRILGFRTSEVAALLFAEQSVHLLFGLPLGWVLGARFAEAMVAEVDPETWRFPWVISSRTFAWATAVVLGSAAACAWWMFHQVRKLDLVSVPKTRE